LVIGEPCKNGRRNLKMAFALWTQEGPRNYASAVGSDPLHKLAFWRMYLGMTRLACSQYTQHYS